MQRMIGRNYEDSGTKRYRLWPSDNKQDDKPYIVSISCKEHCTNISNGFNKMKQVAESYLGKPVTHAVVTVPAYFDDAQRGVLLHLFTN